MNLRAGGSFSCRFVLFSTNVIGGLILIIVVQHYFAIAVAVALTLYYLLYRFYSASAREVKRLESILRSDLYNQFSESLSGRSTIKAFGRLDEYARANSKSIDIQNRAYLLTTSNQRWVACRLDVMSSMLTLIVGLVAIAERESLSPASLGVALTSILTMQQAFSFCVRQLALVEQYMNSPERLLHYADIESEKTSAGSRDITSWPSQGTIDFKGVTMRYRQDLPLVLRGLSFSIQGGESIGVCGQTGAGKPLLSMR
jgi:ATP-binding cassette subfamily C (CFTR/MRP) protein 1